MHFVRYILELENLLHPLGEAKNLQPQYCMIWSIQYIRLTETSILMYYRNPNKMATRVVLKATPEYIELGDYIALVILWASTAGVVNVFKSDLIVICLIIQKYF